MLGKKKGHAGDHGGDDKDDDHKQEDLGDDSSEGNTLGGLTGSLSKVADAAVPFVAQELLIDGSFEQSSVGADSWTHSKTVGGWKSDSEIETWGKGFYGLKATDGDKIAELDYDTKASNIYQDVKTETGAEYTFSFDYAKRPDSKNGSDTIQVYWNDKLVGTVDPTSSAWSRAEFKVVGTGGNDRIEFREAGEDNDSYGGLLDNASLKKSGPSTAEIKIAADAKAAADKIAADAKAAADKAAADAKAAADKAAADAKAAADKIAADAKAAADKAAADAKAAADKAAADAKAAADKVAYDAAHKADILLKTADVRDLVAGVTLHGSKSADTVDGGKGEDILFGHDGDDVMSGDAKGAVTVDLKIDASLTNASDPNAVSIDLGGIPADAKLSAGVRNQDGTWTLTHDELSGLKITTTDSQDFDLSVKATATDGSGLSASSVIHVTMLTGANDTLVGGKGNDSLSGDDGDDLMYGGSVPTGVANPARVSTAADNDKLFGGAGNDKMYGNAGDDYLDGGDGNDWVSGGKGNDVLTGGSGNNTLYGNTGDDLFVAAGGNDTVVGGSGFDTIDFSASTGGVNVNLHSHTMTGFGTGTISGVEAVIGSKFGDVITADGKLNVLTGGEGDDTFVWGYTDAKRGADSITDFAVGDRIDLHAVTKGDASRLMLKDDGTNTHVFAMVDKSWVEVVKLDGFTGHAQADMLKDGSILV